VVPTPTSLSSTAIPQPTPPPQPTSPPAPTEIPKPTEDPFPAARADLSKTKLGVHVILNNDWRILEFVKRVKPRVMKGVDNLDWLAKVKEVSPKTVTIGRFTDTPNRDVLDNKDPAQYPKAADFARNYINFYLARYRANPGVDYWEGWNEPQPNKASEWDWYAAFEAERACQMKDLGMKAAVGGFSGGRPEYADMARFIPAIQAIQKCGGVFHLHEYASPLMQTGVGVGIPGAPANLNKIAGSLTLRYRYWYEGYLKPRKLVVPLVISEGGIDAGVGQGCPQRSPNEAGWFSCYKDWGSAGLGPDMWRVYLDQLKWYDAELRKDDYVVGVTLFTAGTASTEWHSFDLNDMLRPIAFYMNEQ
jgi:hypothetical protein